jgi:hypothetical protein
MYYVLLYIMYQRRINCIVRSQATGCLKENLSFAYVNKLELQVPKLSTAFSLLF